MAEVYAGFLSHADDQLGRLLDYLEEVRPAGKHARSCSCPTTAPRRRRPERVCQREQVLQRPPRHHRSCPCADRRPGQPADVQPLPHRLGLGLQHAVQDVEALRELPGRHGRPNDRFVARAGKANGHTSQYTHAIDIVPTIYELLGIEMPDVVKGFTQYPLEGESFAASLRDPKVPASRRSSTRCSAPAPSITMAGRPHR